MAEQASPYEGLTEAELSELEQSSRLRPNEDATTWANRARLEADKAAAVAADRRRANAEPAEATDGEGEPPAASLPPDEATPEGSTTSTQP